MLRRTLFLILFAAGVAGGARAGDSDCVEGVCAGRFEVGPYKFQFFATQKSDGERFYREIPSFGRTRLTVALIGQSRADAAAASQNPDIDVALSWGKNELKPPQLLQGERSRAGAPVSFEHDFVEDGKYIIAVVARTADGATYRGEHNFFVIASADSDYLLVGAASLFILGFALIVWRRRRKPLIPPAPPS